MLASNITEAKSTKGDEIRNENVTPIGNPAFVKPMNIGIELHEQNGVTVPRSAPMMFAHIPLNLPKILRVLSGEKND
jgi:hypothetical protein